MSDITPRPARRTPLSRDRILRAALRLIDQRGLDALTMRRLGAELGVEAMSLYKHVPSKDAILDGVRGLLVAELRDALAVGGPSTGWREDLGRFARTYHALGVAHPEAFALLAREPERAYVAGRDLVEAVLERLVEAGCDRETAIRAERIVVRYVLGFTLIDRAGEDAPPPLVADELDALAERQPLVGHLARSLRAGGDATLFEFGLLVLLDGLEQHIAALGGSAC